MAARSGEKIGWTVGWTGTFVWVAVAALVLLAGGKVWAGLWGVLLAGLAGVGIVVLAPWRHPTTPAWKLMLPLLVLVGASVGWALQWWRGTGEAATGWLSMLWLVPLLVALATAGRRRWIDGE